jgi:hypothetical protein
MRRVTCRSHFGDVQVQVTGDSGVMLHAMDCSTRRHRGMCLPPLGAGACVQLWPRARAYPVQPAITGVQRIHGGSELWIPEQLQRN